MKLFQKNLVRKTGALALSLLLTLSLLLSGATLASAQASVLTEGEIALLDAIDYDYVFSHVKYIADEIGIGVAGGPTEKRRAAYLAGQLESLGYEPFSYATDADGVADYFQTFYNDSGITSITGGTITVAGHEYPANAPNWSAASVYKGYETPTVAGDTVYFATVAEAV
ncbi:MAG: hypothetical protein LBT60_04555, partial [Oscillospiraceae bacterium]|nr:hypothetical protein [Oscillospiraceae bacterium]